MNKFSQTSIAPRGIRFRMSRGALLVTCLLTAVAAQAGEDDYPVFARVQETLTRDSNFSRTDKEQAETISTTSAIIGLNKDYGRQNYSLNGMASRNHYAHYGDTLNNTSSNLTGGFKTDILRNWRFTLGGEYQQNLNPIQNNSLQQRVTKNIRTYRDQNASLKYGLDGDWTITAAFDQNRQAYSVPSYRSVDANQSSRSLGVNYNVTDKMYYEIAFRGVSTRYPETPTKRIQYDNNIDLSANWMESAQSNFDARLSPRVTTYSDDSSRKIRGWYGSLNWNFAPRGIWTYNTSISKNSGADRRQGQLLDTTATSSTDLVTSSTSFRFGATAAVTGKTSLSYSYQLTKNRFNLANEYGNLTSGIQGYLLQTYGYYVVPDKAVVPTVTHISQLSLTYVPMRSVTTQCDLQFYSQTRDQNGVRFSGRSLGCFASFTINPL